MPTYSLKINGVERDVLMDSFDLQMVANGVDTLRIDCDASGSPLYRPEIDDEVIFRENGIAIFGGIITQAPEECMGGPALEDIVTKVSASSFDVFATYRVVSETLATGTLKSMLTTLVTNYLTDPGIMLDPGQADGPILEEIIVTRTRLDQVLNDLAVRTHASSSPASEEFVWHIDANKQLKMWEAGSIAAPFDLLDTGTVHQVGDVKVTATRDDTYANRLIVVVTGAGPSTSTENFVAADGVSIAGFTYFTTKYPTAQDINTVWPNELYFDGVGQGPIAWGILTPQGQPNLISSGGLFAWAWDYLNHRLVFDEGSGGAFPGSPSETITVMYLIGYPFDVIVEDVSAQAAPIYIRERVIEVEEGLSLDAATEYAEALLRRQLAVVHQVEYASYDTGLKPGQVQTITLDKRNVDGSFILRNVNARIEPGWNTLRYEVLALEGIPGSSYHIQNDPRQTYQDWLNGPAPKHVGVAAGPMISTGGSGPIPGGPQGAVQYNNQGGFAGTHYLINDPTQSTSLGGYDPMLSVRVPQNPTGLKAQLALANDAAGDGASTFLYTYDDGRFEMDVNGGEGYASRGPGDVWFLSDGLSLTGSGVTTPHGSIFVANGANAAGAGSDLLMVALEPGVGGAGTVPSGQSGAGVHIQTAIDTAASGTHGLIGSLVIEAPTIGSNGATVTDAAALTINAAPSVGTNKYAVLSRAGRNFFGGTVQLKPVAFASLPASPQIGDLACVNNSTTNVWGATIAGGGGNTVVAFYNGANWTVVGK